MTMPDSISVFFTYVSVDVTARNPSKEESTTHLQQIEIVVGGYGFPEERTYRHKPQYWSTYILTSFFQSLCSLSSHYDDNSHD